MNSLRDKLIQETVEWATNSFSKHVITESSAHDGLGRWTLHRLYPDGKQMSDMWCEIIEGRGGYLYVNGDISAAIFGIYGGRRDVTGPGRMVAWIARQNPRDSYMVGKLRIAMGTVPDLARQWRADVAADDIEAWLEDDDENPDLDGETRAQVKGLIDRLRTNDIPECDQQQMYQELDQAGLDAETFGTWGLITSHRLITAWAAVRRLHALLPVKEGGEP